MYNNTEEFVAELQNYLKVAKVCDNEHLADCFGYESFIDKDNKKFDLEDADNGIVFAMPKNSTSDFESNTLAIVTIDGTSMVLAWNKKCEILEQGVYEWSNNTNISTKCVVALMDVNGTKEPDKLGKDIVLLNTPTLNNLVSVKFTVNGITHRWTAPFVPTPLTLDECLALKNEGKIQYCDDENSRIWKYLGDRWAGAVQMCGGTDKMPDAQALADLATYLYDGKIAVRTTAGTTYCPKQNNNYTKCLNTTKLSNLGTDIYNEYKGLNSRSFYPADGSFPTYSYSNTLIIWSGQEVNSYHSSYRKFNDTATQYGDYSCWYTNYWRYEISAVGICTIK